VVALAYMPVFLLGRPPFGTSLPPSVEVLGEPFDIGTLTEGAHGMLREFAQRR
jgi:hypothetical protein